jgi:hypothetical protein
MLGEASPQLRLDGGSRSQCGGLGAEGGRGPAAQHDQEQDERARQPGRHAARAGQGPRRAGQQPGQQAGLRQNQPGGHQAQRDRGDQVTARCASGAQQPPVERP